MRLLVVAIGLYSVSTLACPNLAGKYKICRSSTGPSSGLTDMVITQSVRNRVTTYVITSTDEYQDRITETFKADGKVKVEEIQDPESGSTLRTLSTFSCSKNAFTTKMEVSMSEFPLMSLTSTYTKSGSQVTIHSEYVDGEDYTERTLICE